ncbi:hypothetical protein DEU29_104184 [Idiomarina aquatica]|uniref:Uncharacterized protein n=1 Tax=Idiomarina aquatica TaxID=1327752 RepID=A0A4V3CPR9_9GAMM|nr:hypothetical protein [Idiomarina aquatica]MBL4742712.1 hypothetical protein [Idiomarina sp.]PHQ74781.1 MAG: hypothetical protein COB75_07365 [Idiomarina sp.]TDP39072.1 hypothetical protein DEU29_104184 [Idiomarina aquatica]
MKRQCGQATVEWLIISVTALSILWFAEQQWQLMEQLREWGEAMIEHYHFIFNYLALLPGSGV